MKTRILRLDERVRVGDWVILICAHDKKLIFRKSNDCAMTGWVKLKSPKSYTVGNQAAALPYITRRVVK